MRKWRQLTVTCAATMIGACQAGGPPEDYGDFRLAWEKLADGSSIARTSMPQGEVSLAIRCWPRSGGGYVCLEAGKAHLGSTMVAKTEEEALPDVHLPFVSADNGYSCQHVIDSSEQIRRRGEDLVSNRLRYDQPEWSKSFVAEYMAENKVGGTAWFPCLKVLDAVRDGSLATLGTTTITRGMAGA